MALRTAGPRDERLDQAIRALVHWGGAAWVGSVPSTGLVVGGQQVVGSRQPMIASPSVGTIIDEEARAAIDTLIVALKSHGLID